MNNRQSAKKLLVHYFKTAMVHAGVYWYSDFQAEIECIVDYIIDAAKEELAKEQQLAFDAPERSQPGHKARLYKV